MHHAKTINRGLRMLLFAAAGAVAGCILLAPLVRGPGDPFGYILGARFGCVAGVVVHGMPESRDQPRPP